MARCVVCNQKVGAGKYFCDDCLEREVGKPPRRGRNLFSWLVFSPFQARNIPSSPWRDIGEALDWVVDSVPKVVKEFGVSVERATDGLCELAGVDKQRFRTKILDRLQESKNSKGGPLWAPWDLIMQPVSMLLLLSILSLIALTFVL